MCTVSCHADIFVMIIGTKEVGVFAKNMIRLVAAKIIVFIPGNLLAVMFIHRPRSMLSIMSYIFISGINKLQIIACFCRGIHPVIIRLLQRCCIVPESLRGKESLVFWYVNFYAPVAAR